MVHLAEKFLCKSIKQEEDIDAETSIDPQVIESKRK
jgi:hypothetical protein